MPENEIWHHHCLHRSKVMTETHELRKIGLETIVLFFATNATLFHACWSRKQVYMTWHHACRKISDKNLRVQYCKCRPGKIDGGAWKNWHTDGETLMYLDGTPLQEDGRLTIGVWPLDMLCKTHVGRRMKTRPGCDGQKQRDRSRYRQARRVWVCKFRKEEGAGPYIS